MDVVYKPSGNSKVLTNQEVAEAVTGSLALKIRRPSAPGKGYAYDILDVVSVTRIGDVVLLEVNG